MKKITLLLLIIAISIPNFLSAQERKVPTKIFGQDLTIHNLSSIEETGFIRCASTEYERALQAQFPERATDEEFENWLNPLIEARKQRIAQEKTDGTFRRVVVNIPIIFHVITGSAGDANDLDASQIEAQIDQLNIDFGNLAGSTDPVAADAEIVFIPATIDPSGNALDEPGINRVYGYPGGINTGTMNATIKPATIWDRSLYANIWTTNLSGGVLGYAQFPSNSTLPGLPADGGSALSDGVVILTGTAGSVANPGTAPPYHLGRTLTHEIGHWIGLRHIWGDGPCGDDDFCADTPESDGPNFGCPNATSCGSADMVENYMDYSDDACFNIFTNDQVGRMLTALENATGLSDLPNSPTGDPVNVVDLDGRLDIEDLNVVDCAEQTLTPDVSLTHAGNTTLTSATTSYYLDADAPVDYNWSGSLAFGEFEIISFPEITTTVGAHTFYAELSEPNGGMDLNPGNDNASESNTFSGGLCASVGNMVYATSTEGVIINDGDTDILNNINTGKPSGYSDYTAIVTDVARAESYDLTININTDGNFPCETRVWIDFNQNCAFDAEEEFDLGGGQNIINGPTSNSPLAFTIPADAVLGNTIMRVSTKYLAAGTPCEVTDGSGPSVDAEIEDYTINVLASLSVDEFGLNSISIYPNPTSEVLNISLSNNDLPDGYRIYNMLGQTLSQEVISTISDLSVNTANLSNGMYFIQITKEGNTVSLPFIKK
jgi:hypothetical protein